MNYSDMVEINVEIEALNLDGIKQNLLDYVQKEAKISIEESVEQAGKSAKDAEDAASVAEDAAISATDCARQASESLGLYYTKEQSDTLLSSKQDTITGAATTITDNNLTANRSLTSNSNGKVDVATTTTTELNYVHGVTSAIQTQLNAKASTALDNLSLAGQRIIDSANGTISNCILEIPQNLKLTLENNVLTLKAGSVLVWGGDTYKTTTTTEDRTWTPSSSQINERGLIFVSRTNGVIQGLKKFTQIYSGKTENRPEWSEDIRLSVYYDTDTKLFNLAGTSSQWNDDWGVAYPICAVEIDGQGNLSFIKDSKGRDMIFNGAGFIGHHAFVYPNVKGLQSYGTNNGVLSSNLLKLTTLSIIELSVNRNSIFAYSTTTIAARNYLGEYNNVSEAPTTITSGIPTAYITSENKHYQISNSQWITDQTIQRGLLLLTYAYNGTTVTDFTIRQPYDRARYLLTDDLYKQIGDVETLLAAI